MYSRRKFVVILLTCVIICATMLLSCDLTVSEQHVNMSKPQAKQKESEILIDVIGKDNEISTVTYTIEGNYIYFGSYPQTEVTDGTLKNELTTKAGTLPNNGNNQNWTSYKYYNGGSNIIDYMWYQDVEYNENKYRGVYFTNYRPDGISIDITNSDSCQNYNGYTTGNIYWFTYEPIKWRILEENNGYATILAELILDSQDYNHIRNNNYENSSIRAWLNDTFYNTAFTAFQKELIQTVTIDNSIKSTNPYRNECEWNNGDNEYVCANTNDKIWLPSEQEITKENYGFAQDPEENDAIRCKVTTDYAQCQGAYTYSGGSYNSNGDWWLRSPSYGSRIYALEVGYDGNSKCRSCVDYYCNGVVPALKIMIK